jgi:hypothetical protein
MSNAAFWETHQDPERLFGDRQLRSAMRHWCDATWAIEEAERQLSYARHGGGGDPEIAAEILATAEQQARDLGLQIRRMLHARDIAPGGH